MSKVRVYEVAKQINMDPKTLVALFQSMGLGDVRNHMSAVEQDAVERVKRQLERHKATEVVEERIRPTVVKRRARSGEGIPEARPSDAGHVPSAAPSVPSHSGSPLARPSSGVSPGFRAPAPPPSRPDAAAARRVPDASPSAERNAAHVRAPAPSGRGEAVRAPAPSTRGEATPAGAKSAPSGDAGHKAPSGRGAAGTLSHPKQDFGFDDAAPVKAAPTASTDAAEGRKPSAETAGPSGRGDSASAGAQLLAASAAEHATVPAPRPSSPSEAQRQAAASSQPAGEATSAAEPSPSAPDAEKDAGAAGRKARPSQSGAKTSPRSVGAQPPSAIPRGVGAQPPSAIPRDETAPETQKAPVIGTDAASASARKDDAAAKVTVSAPADAAASQKAKPTETSAVSTTETTPSRSGAGPRSDSPAATAKPGGPSSAPAKGEGRGTHGRTKDDGRGEASPRSGQAGGPTSQKDGPHSGPTSGRTRQVDAPIKRAPALPPLSARPIDDPSAAPKRPSSPPKTGIDVWQGRPGVPMPAPPRTTGAPPARRTTYDPRAGNTAARPQTTFGPQSRGPMGQRGGRPGGGRPGQQMQRGGPQIARNKGPVTTQEMASHKKVVKIEEQVTLQQLAAKMSVKSVDLLMKLLQMGMTGVHINSTLDTDTAKIIASEFGWAVEDVAVSEADTLATATSTDTSNEDGLQLRPPIVTVMGHVDHGKTSLLDRIRKASVADGEAGGITQHIGAYRVETARGTIAFLDTPGHEAFTAMRARGASVTDAVILVVAADDGVMPQTREAINHAQAAKVPIIVAINKIDKPGAEPEKIKRDLANLGLQPEEWGGETMFAQVSAKNGQGIDHLLELVLLQSEVLELKANPKRRASGTVIEALLDRGRGPVARVMVQDGTLHVGDTLLAGAAWGKVRAMTDELGRPVGEAGPSTPVEVLGLNEVPSAGDPVHSVKDNKTAEEIAETRRKKASKTLIPQDSRVSLEALTTRLAESEQLELKLIIKGDVQGSVEAVVHALSKLSTPRVKVTIVHAAVGGITEGDVNLAVASKAVIVGFNVRPAGKAASHAETEGVEIRLYNIIYHAVDDIRSAMEGLLPATKVEKALGRAEVRQVFRIVKIGNVAGCMVQSGLVKRTAEARLIRDNVVVWSGKLSALRRFKDDAKEVAEGFECGISLENFQDMKEHDIIECFEIEEVKTKLA